MSKESGQRGSPGAFSGTGAFGPLLCPSVLGMLQGFGLAGGRRLCASGWKVVFLIGAVWGLGRPEAQYVVCLRLMWILVGRAPHASRGGREGGGACRRRCHHWPASPEPPARVHAVPSLHVF